MALARIRTHFPEEVNELSAALAAAGYTVETLRPEDVRNVPADLELVVDKLPVIEAWRHIPNTEKVYVAPGTPESRDIRSAFGAHISYEPLMARTIVEFGELSLETTRWMKQQFRELRAWFHDLRRRWTPPREYRTDVVHLDPVVPSTVERQPGEPRIDAAMLELMRREEELRRQRAAEQRRRAELARVAEENRRRAREAVEARALLEEQQKIEAMVRATETLRERVVHAESKPLRVKPRDKSSRLRRMPRRLFRTERDRAFFRAGVTAFVLSCGLAVLAAESLHPHPASRALPRATSAQLPFAQSQSTSTVPTQVAAPNTAGDMPASAPAPQMTAALKTSERRSAAPRHPSVFADDEVIVRHPDIARTHPPKRKDAVLHYSDLD